MRDRATTPDHRRAVVVGALLTGLLVGTPLVGRAAPQETARGLIVRPAARSPVAPTATVVVTVTAAGRPDFVLDRITLEVPVAVQPPPPAPTVSRIDASDAARARCRADPVLAPACPTTAPGALTSAVELQRFDTGAVHLTAQWTASSGAVLSAAGFVTPQSAVPCLWNVPGGGGAPDWTCTIALDVAAPASPAVASSSAPPGP